ncbi:hypothetical protein L6452_31177 [Arctium lappa]|uniref:Uncharacterized protein n=1 Tax=Arctium lappa TaxID=4217 RepID=A0ACB8ZPK6_ARCLA|nr:hypothetical protein L6452_31177 [Arctium lappa]
MVLELWNVFILSEVISINKRSIVTWIRSVVDLDLGSSFVLLEFCFEIWCKLDQNLLIFHFDVLLTKDCSVSVLLSIHSWCYISVSTIFSILVCSSFFGHLSSWIDLATIRVARNHVFKLLRFSPCVFFSCIPSDCSL